MDEHFGDDQKETFRIFPVILGKKKVTNPYEPFLLEDKLNCVGDVSVVLIDELR